MSNDDTGAGGAGGAGGAVTVPMPGGGHRVRNAPESKPAAINVSVSPMSPVAAAGVRLALYVLNIVIGAIVLLMLYLAWMDWQVAGDIRQSYRDVLDPSRLGAELQTVEKLDRLAVDLGAAQSNTTLVLVNGAQQNAQAVLRILDRLPSLSAPQKVQLKECLPVLPVDAARSEKLLRCQAILEAVRAAALDASANERSALLAGEAVGKIGEQRQQLRAFWLQAAQLLLLNLLLPLLTALFGYVFGTQQSQRNGG